MGMNNNLVPATLYDFNNKERNVNYYMQTLLNKTLTMFKYTGLPDSIPEKDLELILQQRGYGIITEHNGELLALWGGDAPPLNPYYTSKKITIANPWSDITKTYTFDEDCILIKNDPLGLGIMDIINKYASLLAECDITTKLALVNFRAIFAITAEDDNQYQSALEFLKNMENGDQGVILSNAFKDGITTQPYCNGSNNYMTQIIEMTQYIKGSFYQEIGLNSNYNMKRERLSASESGLNEDVLRPLVDSMFEERQKFLDEVNKMYGTNITIEFDSSWKQYNDEEIDETNELNSDEDTDIDIEDETTISEEENTDVSEEVSNETDVTEEDTTEDEEVSETDVELTESIVKEIKETIVEVLTDEKPDEEEKEPEEQNEEDEEKEKGGRRC